MPKTFYHVSTKQYEVGQVVAVPAGLQTEFHSRLLAAKEAVAEERLLSCKPAAAQCRLSTQYAFDDEFQCLYYGNTEYKDQELHFYQVEMNNPTEVPMALVDVIKKLDNPSPTQVARIVAEYWNPSLKWNVKEYLAPSMTVLAEIPKPKDDDMMAHGAVEMYGSDINLAKKVASAVMANQPLPAQEEEDEDEE